MLEKLQVPEWTERPLPQNLFLWNAFLHLQGSRNYGGSIPFSEISRYADEVGIACPVARGRLVSVITAMDRSERG